MARSVRFTKVEGLSELSDAIEQLKDRVSGDEVRKVLMEGAQLIKQEARDRAPVDSGLLRDSIIAVYGDKQKTDRLNVLLTVKRGKDGANHAHLVEFGTSTMQPQPFFRPAIASKKNECGELIVAGLKKIITEKQ